VFLKRLNMGMKLQSDATASYGAVLDGVNIDELQHSQLLAYKSAYNTYINNGLPPGPISNISETAITAVSNPATTDWLYFVSGDDKVTYFSKTLEEHEALVRQHCSTLCGN
ncbi:MAG: endolytic transglycosylase MltG, partial [Microthrixaceae bacterium]|nr:endolytic transglycosylase MltG [Microthrixaceae bacterium]